MLSPVNEDDNLIAARLLDFFAAATPWHRALWNAGLVLALRETLEASEAVRSGVLAEEALKGLGSNCLRLAGLDAGAGAEEHRHALQQALMGKVRYDGLDFHSLKQLADQIESRYLERWAVALRSDQQRPKAERAARSVAAHLLDLGFSSDYLHRWWRFKLVHESGSKSLAEIIEEAHALAQRAAEVFEVLVLLKASPRSRSGYPPDWLSAADVSRRLREKGCDVTGLRPSGGLVLSAEARDADSAVQIAAEMAENFLARVSVGTGASVDRIPQAWVSGEREPRKLGLRFRGVRVRALYREDRIYPSKEPPNILDAAIEMLAHLERSSPSAAVAGGWAAIEALLSEPNDRGAAAERLATLVACSFPRAELTVLSYVLEKTDSGLKAILAQCNENRDRASAVARAILNGQTLSVPDPSDQAALSRMEKLLNSPRKSLDDIKTHAADAFARLYRQRNLVLHWGKTNGVALRASLRTAAPLVGAGMDRIAHGWYVQRIRPIELAARARVSLATVMSDDIGCLRLLD